MVVVNQLDITTNIIISDTTSVGTTITVPESSFNLIICSTVASRTDGTFTTTIEHSPNGTNWFTLDATAAQSANGMVMKAVTIPSFSKVRSSIVSTGVTVGATVTVKLWFS